MPRRGADSARELPSDALMPGCHGGCLLLPRPPLFIRPLPARVIPQYLRSSVRKRARCADAAAPRVARQLTPATDFRQTPELSGLHDFLSALATVTPDD